MFGKNTSLETKFPSPFGWGNLSSLDNTLPKHDISVLNKYKRIQYYAKFPQSNLILIGHWDLSTVRYINNNREISIITVRYQ